MNWKPIAFISAHILLAIGWVTIFIACIAMFIMFFGMLGTTASVGRGMLASLLGAIWLVAGVSIVALGRFIRKHTEPQPNSDTPSHTTVTSRSIRRGADVFWVGLVGLTMVLQGTAWKALQWFQIVD